MAKEQRAEFLAGVHPHISSADAKIVKPLIIELILKTDVTSENSLRRMLGLGCKFGAWCRNNTYDGEFIPARDFTEERLGDYDIAAHTNVDRSTAATYQSILRKVGGNKSRRRIKGRRVAAAPYPDAEVDLLWDSAIELEVWTGIEMRTLLALSFGVGARSEEINQMRASQIDKVGRTTIVSITRRGELREVPVYGQHAAWLRERAAELDPDDYLFRPRATNRADAIGSLIRKAGSRAKVFENFKVARARHTWLCNYMQRDISYSVLRSAADVGPGSNLFADLSPHLPYVSPAQRRRAFDDLHYSSKEKA